MADETLRLRDDECLADCAYDLYLTLARPSGHDYGDPTEKAVETFARLARALEREGMTVAGVLKSCENAEYFLAYNGDPDFKEDHLRRVRVLRALRDGSEG